MATKCILIVDDEPLVLKATGRTLRLAGHDVHLASNLAQAVSLCEERSFDVFVVDFMIPGTNGLELLAKLRKVQPLAKAVVISGKLDQHEDEKAITGKLKQQVEADLFLHKPVDSKRIVSALDELFTDNSKTEWKDVAKQMLEPTKRSVTVARKVASDLPKRKGPK